MALITDPEILESFRKDQSGVAGRAAGLLRPKTTAEVAEFVTESFRLGRKILPVGLQTATTAAAVPQDDVVISLASMAGVVDIDAARKVAEVLPGTVTIDLKAAVEAAGLYYPPDPTSEKESTIGGNVGSNASGARTFRWGMTADWLEGLEVVTGEGQVHRCFRRVVDKNTAGYLPFLNPMLLFPGSEGTLGIVTRIWVKLIDHPGPFAAFILYFRGLDDALACATAFRAGRMASLPRCVELFDARALEIVSGHDTPPKIPAAAGAALYTEFDTAGAGIDEVIEGCLAPLVPFGLLLDDTLVAQTLAERERVREWRHFVPETCNQWAARHHADGGIKVSTEFCVPHERLAEMMQVVDETARDAGVDILVRYGHIGNGHPHIFMRGRDRDEVARLKKLAHVWYAKATALGGTVSGEHGIGKTRRDILKYMYPPHFLKAMRETKRVLDPAGILAMGNIFAETEALVPEYL
jgi:FAD/FMN-containing dehydrogenase